MEVTLLADYPQAIHALLEELGGLGSGDEARLELYLLEPGESSQAVLAALRAAAERGVRVRVALDASAASALSRLVEGTGTLRGAARALARALPGRVELVRRAGTDHAKVLSFLRPGGVSSALFGGMNLGDRFRAWRDFMVLVRGSEAVAALEQARAGRVPLPPAAALGAEVLRFVANAPAAGVFQVRAVFEALFDAPAWEEFRIAMAYLDRRGAALIARALARGAQVELWLPRDPNVYPQANLRALAGLLGGPHAHALRVGLIPGMLHAKALLARGTGGRGVAFLGSANLKRNSLDRFGELDALVAEPRFLADLTAALDRYALEAEPLRAPPRYRLLRAWLEELLG